VTQAADLAAPTRRGTTVLWEGSAHQVDVAQGESVLEACLRKGIPIPHSCKAGKCGKCLGRCLAGQVDMRGGPDFRPCIPQEAIGQGAILACSSYPESAGACIAFDPITTASVLPQAPVTPAGSAARESKFDLFSSLAYGWLTISLAFPLLMEFILVPLFSLVLSVDNVVARTCLGGAVVLTAFVLAPLVHYAEAYIFRLPVRFDLLGRIPLSASLKAPFFYFPAAIVIWMCIELAIAHSSGVYRTPSIGEMFVFMTVIQLSNLFVMDLVFWLVHGPKGLHHPALYRHLHAKHHRQRVSTFSTGPDLAPIDMMAEVSIFTVVPIACGLLLGFDSLAFIFCSLINTLMTSTWAHSPYQISKIVPQASVTQYVLFVFPWLVANPHQSHHAKIECNYSIWGFWDKVFGTFEPMTDADERTARAIHLAELERPDTFSFLYPARSLAPYIELVAAYGFCALLWFTAVRADFHPLMEVKESLLPWPAFFAVHDVQASCPPFAAVWGGSTAGG
jgi:sterol desaturase/sphingolipid hydroxylase (fatty acid hydroxylase superfamily)/ferredoxin